MLLNNQITCRIDLNSNELLNIFELPGDFHDAQLSFVKTSSDQSLFVAVTLPRWIFLEESHETDFLTKIHFRFREPVFSDAWGSDLEICKCSIYHFRLHENKFDLQTGDGGRTGQILGKESSAKIFTTKEISKLIDLGNTSLT